MSNRTADLDLTGATEAFCARLSAEGRSPATIAAYRRDLALVARVAGELTPGIVCRAVTAGLLDQVFSAGADLDEARAGLATDPVWERLSGAIANAPCLTIAALNGTLAGGAFGMALACDLRIAVPEARFFYPVMKLGFLPQPSDPKRLAALIGPARARMILMAGQKIGAEEALAWGLIDRIVPRDALDEAIATLTADALGATSGHVAGIKALVG